MKGIIAMIFTGEEFQHLATKKPPLALISIDVVFMQKTFQAIMRHSRTTVTGHSTATVWPTF